jgi:uncharacterized membrane protein
MNTSYNRIAGRSVERLAALSDGIFSVAMTLLVLDLHTPLSKGIDSDQALWHVLGPLWPQVVTYLMSFLTLGIFWMGQQAQLNHFETGDRNLMWIHITFLFAVSMMPFSTRLLSEFIELRTALLIYWANILLLGLVLFASWRYARRAKLLKDEVTDEISRAMERRIRVAQLLYAVGAALCLYNTYASIAFIVLVQLNFAIAPKVGWLNRF